MPIEIPNTPDLAISRHVQLAEAFEVFAAGLGPFIDGRMTDYFADDLSWEATAANRMGRANEHGATDPLFQLLVLRRFWGPVFADFFGEDLRGLIGQLIEARNLWAHFNLPDDTQYLDRILLSIERVSAPVAPEGSSRLRQIRARMKNPVTDDTDNMLTEDIDVILLRSQLGETEGAFQDLQDQFADMKAQLDLARKASAGRQLRLSMLERELLEASGETSLLQGVLHEERVRAHRIEWLFVGFIAALLVMMIIQTS